MANLMGYTKIFAGDTTVIDTQKMHPLGTRSFDENGNEYIYLTGVASTVYGSWVTFDEDHVTILATANAVGRVAIAMAATVASTYGWYQIYGMHASACVRYAAFADNGIIYLTSIAGYVDNTDVAGDLILGSMGKGAAQGSAANVEISYPHVNDTADD